MQVYPHKYLKRRHWIEPSGLPAMDFWSIVPCKYCTTSSMTWCLCAPFRGAPTYSTCCKTNALLFQYIGAHRMPECSIPLGTMRRVSLPPTTNITSSSIIITSIIIIIISLPSRYLNGSLGRTVLCLAPVTWTNGRNNVWERSWYIFLSARFSLRFSWGVKQTKE